MIFSFPSVTLELDMMCESVTQDTFRFPLIEEEGIFVYIVAFQIFVNVIMGGIPKFLSKIYCRHCEIVNK